MVSGAGWMWGLLGVQPGVGAATGGPIPAIYMVGTWFVEYTAVGGDFRAPWRPLAAEHARICFSKLFVR